MSRFQSSLRRTQLGPYLGADFVTEGRNLIPSGKLGLGKTHAAANVLFGVIDQRCLRRKPIVFTTNKKLREWGQVLHDEQLAEALLDRVLERGQHIALGGRSWRTRNVDPATLGGTGGSGA